MGIIAADLRLSLEMLLLSCGGSGRSSFVSAAVFPKHAFSRCVSCCGWSPYQLSIEPHRVLPATRLRVVSGILFTMAGIPVTQDGTVLAIPGLTLEVAKECSSIRSSSMLVVTTMVMAHLLLRSFWGKALVTLAAIPLSIAKNGLRIFILSVLGVYVDRGILEWPPAPPGWDSVLSVISGGLVCTDLAGGMGGAQGDSAGTQRAGSLGVSDRRPSAHRLLRGEGYNRMVCSGDGGVDRLICESCLSKPRGTILWP